jgi:hypothetical protein
MPTNAELLRALAEAIKRDEYENSQWDALMKNGSMKSQAVEQDRRCREAAEALNRARTKFLAGVDDDGPGRLSVIQWDEDKGRSWRK